MAGERWRKLEVWKLGDELARKVYEVSRGFPKEELYGLTSQIRGAALSIPTNVVEGYSRKGDKELAHFVNISIGSLAEVKYLLHFASTLEIVDEEQYESLDRRYDDLGGKLWSFYQKVRAD